MRMYSTTGCVGKPCKNRDVLNYTIAKPRSNNVDFLNYIVGKPTKNVDVLSCTIGNLRKNVEYTEMCPCTQLYN